MKKSLDDGYLVGSRGSVGSSFVATMTEITEVNPLPPHICSHLRQVSSLMMVRFGSGFDLPDKNVLHELIKEGQDIPFETFLDLKEIKFRY